MRPVSLVEPAMTGLVRCRPQAGSFIARALVLVLVLCWAFAQRSPHVALHCVSQTDSHAWSGVYLRVLLERPCGPGQSAMAALRGIPVGFVVVVAIPTLLGNLLTLLGALGAFAAVRVVLARAASALGLLVPRIPTSGWVPEQPVRSTRCRWPGRQRLRSMQLDRSPVLRRGPPPRYAF